MTGMNMLCYGRHKYMHIHVHHVPAGLYTLDGESIEYGPMQAMVQPARESRLHVLTIPPPSDS